MKSIAFGFFCTLLIASQACAWLLQPPVEVPEVQTEIDTFQAASAAMLSSFAKLNAVLSEAERTHTPVSPAELAIIRGEIQAAIGLYRAAATENLAKLPMNIAALNEVSAMLASNLRRDGVPEMTNAADLALAMADIASEIDQTLAIIIEIGGMSPEDPVNIQAREGIAELTHQMNLLVQVGNAGAAGIGVSFK